MRTAVRSTLGASAALSGAVVPVFLLGSLSLQIRRELVFDETALGATVTGFFLAGAVTAIPGGRLAERIGARRSLVLGVTLSATIVLTLAAVASSWWHLTVLYSLAGATLGLVDPGAARALADGVPDQLQGIAFGVKEASVPAASLAAGAAVPLLGATLGWRPAFVLAALAAPLVWLLVPRNRPTRNSPDREGVVGAHDKLGEEARSGDIDAGPAIGPLAVTSAGTALAAGASTAMATFLVPSAAVGGFSSTAAGVLLVGGSLVGIGARLVMGWQADRTTRSQMRVVANMMAAGALGLALLAFAGGSTALVLIGTALGFGAGWGWTGLLFLSVVRSSADAPASAAGIVLAGLGVGGALGPLAFGALVEANSYAAAWTAAAAVMACGAAGIFLGDVLLRRVTSSSGAAV